MLSLARIHNHTTPGPDFVIDRAETPIIWRYLHPTWSDISVGGKTTGRRLYQPCHFGIAMPDQDRTRISNDGRSIQIVTLPIPAIAQTLGTDHLAFLGRLEQHEPQVFCSPLIDILATRLAECEDTNSLPLYGETLTRSIIFELKRLLSSSTPEAEDAQGLPQETLTRINNFIEAEAGAKVEVETLAQMANMSPSRFYRAFKRSFGTPPYKHLVNRRIAKAIDMIANTNLSLAEVSYQCGFSSQSHMTTLFKDRTGRTPRYYRDEATGKP